MERYAETGGLPPTAKQVSLLRKLRDQRVLLDVSPRARQGQPKDRNEASEFIKQLLLARFKAHYCSSIWRDYVQVRSVDGRVYVEFPFEGVHLSVNAANQFAAEVRKAARQSKKLRK